MALAFATLWLRRTWGNIRIEALILTITQPVVGADPKIVLSGALWILGPVLLAGVAWFLAFRLAKRFPKLGTLVSVASSVLPFLLLFAAFRYADNRYDIIDFLSANRHQTEIYSNGTYVAPESVKIKSTGERNNLIVVYLESVENSFFAESAGGATDRELMPELAELLKEETNVSFSHTEKYGGPQDFYGTGWSVASYVATLGGLPLSSSIENDLVDLAFMPGARMLTDVLADEGYIQEVVKGGQSRFAGVSELFATHGDVSMFDYPVIEKEYSPEEQAHCGWGIKDYVTLSVAKERIGKAYAEAQAASTNFNVMIITLDLHTPNGYLCPECPSDVEGHYPTVISCQSKQIFAFTEWCKTQPWYEETTIALIGDHPSMARQHVGFIPSDYTRTTFNCFIHSKATPVSTKNRVFTRCDFYPTLLAAIGYSVEGDRLALGTNLFSDKPTRAEEMGLKTLDYETAGLDTEFTRKIYGGIMF